MRLLLDSHALLWAIADDPKLSNRTRALILSDDNEVFYSPASLYEIAFKASRGRMPTAATRLPEAVSLSGFDELRLTSLHFVHAARLEWDHGDPWDRILLAQATLEDTELISVDRVFDEMTERRLW